VNAAKNIENAKSAGFSHVDTYMFPCSHGKTAQSQADGFYNGLAMQFANKNSIIVSDENESVVEGRGLRAGYYPGWDK